MAGGLFPLLKDISAIAKSAAAGLDDVAGAAGKATMKSAAVVVDDTAVTPQYVSSIPAHRELMIVRNIAFGSIKNKLLVILPVAMVLSQFAEWALPVLLIFGGLFLSFEGAESVLGWFGHGHDEDHDTVQSELSPHDDEKQLIEEEASEKSDSGAPTRRERKLIGGAVRTDLILSTEIMLIALASIETDSFWIRFATLIVVAFAMTFTVYGAVALLVRMDDFGLYLATKNNLLSKKIGRGFVLAMPKVLSLVTIIGTFAMLWVGGHLMIENLSHVGVHVFHNFSHYLVSLFGELGPVGKWFLETLIASLFAVLVGLVVVYVISFALKIFEAVKTTKLSK